MEHVNHYSIHILPSRFLFTLARGQDASASVLIRFEGSTDWRSADDDHAVGSISNMGSPLPARQLAMPGLQWGIDLRFGHMVDEQAALFGDTTGGA